MKYNRETNNIKHLIVFKCVYIIIYGLFTYLL